MATKRSTSTANRAKKNGPKAKAKQKATASKGKAKKPTPRTRKTAKTPPAESPGPDPLVKYADMDPMDILVMTVRDGAMAMAACVDQVKASLSAADQEYDRDLVSHLAWMIDKSTRMIGELRKLENHDRMALRKITPEKRFENVMLYLGSSELPAGKRVNVRALLDEMDQKDSVLG